MIIIWFLVFYIFIIINSNSFCLDRVRDHENGAPWSMTEILKVTFNFQLLQSIKKGVFHLIFIQQSSLLTNKNNFFILYNLHENFFSI